MALSEEAEASALLRAWVSMRARASLLTEASLPALVELTAPRVRLSPLVDSSAVERLRPNCPETLSAEVLVSLVARR
jgi:hypothetical protein